MNFTCIIAYRNDKFIWHTLYTLIKHADLNQIEILVVDDFSDDPFESYYPWTCGTLRVIRNKVQQGVGQSFENGVKQAKYDNIILMGSDVLVKDRSWLTHAKNYVLSHPNGIGCSTCLSLDPDHLDPKNPADEKKRYGAEITPYVTTEDLPSDSPLLELDTYHVDMWETKWIKKASAEEYSEVPCVYGAFYVTTKSWYNHIHGWDNSHKIWGGLEQWLSLKNWLYGGECHNIRDLETGHIFHKFMYEDTNTFVSSGAYEKYWYNKLFIGATMLADNDSYRLMKKVYETKVKYELPTHQFNLGNAMIKKDADKIRDIWHRNQREFKHDFDWYCERFKIKKNW